jgi:hypothetical protein
VQHTTRWIQWIVGLGGLFYTLIGVAQLFAPGWFFWNIGLYPPFNRHYIGDLGSFTLPMGIALLLAVRDPIQHRLLIGFVAAGSVIHSLNHLYDNLTGVSADLWGTVALIIFALVLAWAFWANSAERGRVNVGSNQAAATRPSLKAQS